MSLKYLPHDLATHMFTYLPRQDILKYRLLCRDTNEMFDSEQVWKVLCNRDGYMINRNIPIDSYHHFYMNFEDSMGSAEMNWFIKFDLNNLKCIINPECLDVISQIHRTPTSVLTCIDQKDGILGDQVIASLLGVTKESTSLMGSEPGIYMWMKPSILKHTSKANLIILRSHGMFDESFSDQQRGLLMKLIQLLSSTVVFCTEFDDESLNAISKILEVEKYPPVFGSYDFMRSCLFCTGSDSDDMRAFDVCEDIGSQNLLEDSGLLSVLLNWFGKCHGMKVNPYKINRNDLNAFVSDLTKPLTFGWPLSAWEHMKPTGTLVSEYIKFLLQEINQIDINTNEKILQKFAKECLHHEMIRSIDFYTKATRAELNRSLPLEMCELVSVSEQHSQNALRIFTQSIKDALFSGHVVGEIESALKNGINSNFRTIWLENSQISEAYCHQIFDSCFKWVKVLLVCPDEEMTPNDLKDRFKESIDVYLQNAKGTRKLQVLSFCTVSYIETLASIYPDYQDLLQEISCSVERRAVYETEKIDMERKKIQKEAAYSLKLQTIENTIHRLSVEINHRKLQCDKSEEYFSCREDRLKKLGIPLYDDKIETRRKYIESLEESMKHEVSLFHEFEVQLKQICK